MRAKARNAAYTRPLGVIKKEKIKPLDYIEFANKSVEEFQEIQNEFRETFKIDDYANWFYNQTTELLTFSTGEDQINFRYIPIGTYSENSKTWMWAWRNEDSIERSKNETQKIREFGKDKQFPKLSKGHFESDKYDGWEFVAIAKKMLGGIGGYRVKSEHLEIYFLVIEQVENEQAEKLKEQTISCEKHGAKRIAFVCQHLIKSDNNGFEEAFPTFKGMEIEEDDDLQAWCDKCEIERLKTDGWNDESMEYAKSNWSAKIVTSK